MLVVGKPIGGVSAAAYGVSGELADRLEPQMRGHEIDVAGVGGTLTGSALAMAAVRATLSSALREDFGGGAAGRGVGGRRRRRDRGGRPALARAAAGGTRGYWFCPPRAPGPPRRRPSTRSSRRSCTCGRSTAGSC